jgi:outer membrane protein OmpA-like peptidoglycan-associated protein
MSQDISKVLSGTSAPPAVLGWDINSQLRHAPRNLSNISIEFDIRDKKDSVRLSKTHFPVEIITKRDREKVNDKYVDKYSLILYEFGSYTHTSAQREILRYIKDHSTDKSTFFISGHTDRSGSEEYNLMLSTRRAEYTARALGLPLTTSKGYGEGRELYDNNLPEGRMYCRTVNVIVETPVEK